MNEDIYKVSIAHIFRLHWYQIGCRNGQLIWQVKRVLRKELAFGKSNEFSLLLHKYLRGIFNLVNLWMYFSYIFSKTTEWTFDMVDISLNHCSSFWPYYSFEDVKQKKSVESIILVVMDTVIFVNENIILNFLKIIEIFLCVKKFNWKFEMCSSGFYSFLQPGRLEICSSNL